MEKLDSLPPAALISFGVALAFIFGVRYLGLWQGERAAPGRDHTSAQVAAVIVDPTALNRLSDQAGRLVEALDNAAEVGQAIARSEQHLAQEIDRVREEMRIQREVRRNRD